MLKIKKNQSGATAILLTFMMLSGITLVALITGDLVQNGIVASRTQVNSTKALFAAEAGIEQVLDSVWKGIPPGSTITCQGADPDSGRVCFDTVSNGVIDNWTGDPNYTNVCSDNCVGNGLQDHQELNDAEYYILYEYDAPTTTLTSVGTYADVNRVVESAYAN